MAYFNPVVEDWTEECQEIEIDEKENKCNFHLYIITKEMKGVFSIAEAVDSTHQKNITCFFQVVPDGFDKSQLRSLKAVCSLIKSRGGLALISNDLTKFTKIIKNGI